MTISLYADDPEDASYVAKTVDLGESVKLVECKYKCGGWFVVTTMARNPPWHYLCALDAQMACQEQMQAKAGPYYDRWVQAMSDHADRWVNGCRIARDRYANQNRPDANP